MRSHAFCSVACLLLALAGGTIAPFAIAQEPSSGRKAVQTASAPTLNLDFSGGTAAEYIAAIRQAQPDANIVTLGELNKVHMPAVRLQNVDVNSAVCVLESIPQNQGDHSVKVQVSNISTNQNAPVLSVVAEVVEFQRARSRPRTQETIVISLADLLDENLKPADALTAIETALDLIKADYDPAQIKFHEETGLLIARGSEEQMQSINQVVQQLRERAGTIQARRERETMVLHQQQNINESVRDAKALRDQYEILNHEVTQWRTKSELLQQEIDKMRRMMAQLEDENRQLRAEYARLAGGAPPSGGKPPSDNSRKPQ